MTDMPHIQYATTTDGERIAYWTLGAGDPYIMCFSTNACETEWEFPEARWAYETLAELRTVVRLDLRGEGLSSRPAGSLSLEAFGRDLDAVIEKLGTTRYALHGGTYSTKLVVRHAALHSDRVTALTLYRPNVVGGASHWESPATEMIAPLRNTQPELHAQLTAVIAAGLEDLEFTFRFAKFLEAWTPDVMAALRQADVTADVERVRAPVLVLHRNRPEFDINVSRALASSFPNGRMAVLGGRNPMPWDEHVVQALRAFLTETAGPAVEPAPVRPLPQLPTGVALILFAYIVDSTALTERIGDAPFRERARALDAVLRAIIAELGGAAVEGKLLGDGVLATFTSAAQGIGAALACARAGEDRGLPLHLGLHAGDVIREGDKRVWRRGEHRVADQRAVIAG